MSLDNTVTLVPDKLQFINKFKKDLKEKLDSFSTKLKKIDYTKEEIIKSIDETTIYDRVPVYYYIAIVLGKAIGIVCDDDLKLFEIKGLGNECLLIDEKQLTYETLPTCDFKTRMYSFREKKHRETNTLEKLNTFLVKDLKAIADDLGLQTFKIEDSKKKNLLKEELKDLIKAKLYT